MSSKNVFVVGPGYVGREVIELLLKDGYKITTLVRRKEAATELEAVGVKAVISDLDDSATITKLASESDIVFHTATADHLASAQAILEGVKKRASEGKKTIYLHQSGTSVLSDGNYGKARSDDAYSDKDTAKVDSVSDDAPHRKIDLAILKVRKELGSKARIFIIIPPIIYGTNSFNRQSIQLPALTRFALKHGYSGHVGPGLSVWHSVHVKDLARAYMIILTAAQSAKDRDQFLADPYFFTENASYSWKEIADVVGGALHKAGRIDSKETREIPKESYGDLFGDATVHVVGNNTRGSADRLRELGWKPQEKGLKEAYESEDVPLLLKEEGFAKPGLHLS